ncbi:MAG: hypothetical protein J5623_06185 [Clostridiales bacterium]|nr:hypothetical protein [Clostridiales bacterium]
MDRRRLIRKIIVYAVYILLLSSLQVSYPGRLGFGGQTADITFVFVVLTGYFFGFKDGVIVGLITGLVRDCLAPIAIVGIDGTVRVTAGIGMLVMFLAGAVGSAFFTKRMHRNVPFAFVSIAFTTLLYKISGHFMAYSWTFIAPAAGNYNLGMYEIVVRSCLLQTMLNLIAGIPILLLLRFAGPVAMSDQRKTSDDVIAIGEENSWLQI